jgi:hypothetical protein
VRRQSKALTALWIEPQSKAVSPDTSGLISHGGTIHEIHEAELFYSRSRVISWIVLV